MTGMTQSVAIAKIGACGGIRRYAAGIVAGHGAHNARTHGS